MNTAYVQYVMYLTNATHLISLNSSLVFNLLYVYSCTVSVCEGNYRKGRVDFRYLLQPLHARTARLPNTIMGTVRGLTMRGYMTK